MANATGVLLRKCLIYIAFALMGCGTATKIASTVRSPILSTTEKPSA